MSIPKPLPKEERDPLWPWFRAEVVDLGNSLFSVRSSRVGKLYRIDEAAAAMLSDKVVDRELRAKITTRLIHEDERFVLTKDVVSEETERPNKSEHERAVMLLRELADCAKPVRLSWDTQGRTGDVEGRPDSRPSELEPTNQEIMARTGSRDWRSTLQILRGVHDRTYVKWDLDQTNKTMDVALNEYGRECLEIAIGSMDAFRERWEQDRYKRRWDGSDAAFTVMANSEQIPFLLNPGDRLFVIGPNGSGKSFLIQHIVDQIGERRIRRLSAHRQTWIASGAIDMTPQTRREWGKTQHAYERRHDSRWREEQPETQLASVLFDLISTDNDQARRIAQHVRANNPTRARMVADAEMSPFQRINRLLKTAGLAVEIRNSRGEELVVRHTGTGREYGIPHMSDGERNAVILAANVLTVDPGTVLLIDEPERHLHRGIAAPFLSALFAERSDCSFIVATHEITLPIADTDAPVLALRSCIWHEGRPARWDATLLLGESRGGLPDETRRTILGSRSKVLFIEGDEQSLDRRLYGALFPHVDIRPVGGWLDVTKAVDGLRSTHGLHEVYAVGLIDRDDRGKPDVEGLRERGVYVLSEYSVESLYYCPDALSAVAEQQARLLGSETSGLIETVTAAALDSLSQEQLERFAALRCRRRVRSRLLAKLPDWKRIADTEAVELGTLEVGQWYREERDHLRDCIRRRDLNSIVARCPIRESRLPDAIAQALELKGNSVYETMLLARVRADSELADRLRHRIGHLSNVLAVE